MLSRYAGNSQASGVEQSGKAIETTGGGGGSANFIDDETPTGTVDGVNDTFTLSETPSPAASLQLFKNGQLMQGGGADYTLTGDTIVYEAGAIPQTGDLHVTFYRYA